MRPIPWILLATLPFQGLAQTNVVVNGGFENPTNFIAGWISPTGIAGELVTTTAAEGRNFVVLGDLYQDLPTVPGQVYRLRYAVAGDPYWQGPTTLQTFWAGSLPWR